MAASARAGMSLPEDSGQPPPGPSRSARYHSVPTHSSAKSQEAGAMSEQDPAHPGSGRQHSSAQPDFRHPEPHPSAPVPVHPGSGPRFAPSAAAHLPAAPPGCSPSQHARTVPAAAAASACPPPSVTASSPAETALRRYPGSTQRRLARFVDGAGGVAPGRSSADPPSRPRKRPESAQPPGSPHR